MITFAVVTAMFAYMLRMRSDLQASIRMLVHRIETLESAAVPAARLDVGRDPDRVVRTPVASSLASPRLPTRIQPSISVPPPAAPVFTASVAADPGRPDSLETEIGSRWLLYVGVIALVVGSAYFEKLAIEKNWIGERARVIEGILAGLALIGGGRRFVRRGYDVYGQIIAGGGVAVLYVSVYSASTLYALIGRGAAIAALCAVTALAAWLADRYRSQGLAVMAVGGGFATPFLLPSTTDAQVMLFTYDGVLIAATMYLSHRRIWPLLNIVSYALTCLTVLSWAAGFYTSSKYLVTEAYLTIYCGMFLYILFRVRRSDARAAFVAEVVLWSVPILYYVSSLAVLEPHSIALLVFLGVVASVGAALAPFGYATIRLAVWCGVAVPLIVWVNGHGNGGWLVPGAIAIGAIYAVNLLALLYVMRSEEGLAEPDVALLHLNPLVLFGAGYLLITRAYPDATSVLALVAAVWNVAVGGALWRARHAFALHFAAVASTLFAIAVGLEFGGEARTIGWSAEGAAIVWLAVREKRAWLRGVGLGVFGVAVIQLMALLAMRPPVDYTVVLNWRTSCGVFVITLLYVLAWLHRFERVGPISAATPFVLAANILTLFLLTAEISAYWYVRSTNSPPNASRLARELMLSVVWAGYATGLIVVGLWRRYSALRYMAMVVFGITILKVFFFDLEQLEQVYRVLSVIVLGVLLLLTSYLYNQSRRSSRI
jgi:uncharacterized membrane protein